MGFSGVLHGTSYEFSGNSWGISGPAPAFSRKSGNGAVRGNLGSRKAFTQTDNLGKVTFAR